VRDFYRAIVEWKRPEVNPQDALDDLFLVNAAFRLSRKRKTRSV
jgi:hypothetical protein